MLPLKRYTARAYFILLAGAIIVCAGIACNNGSAKQDTGAPNLFEYQAGQEPRWSSPENINGEKGAGGKENNGAKGHSYDSIAAGQSKDLVNIQTQGIINRIWIT